MKRINGIVYAPDHGVRGLGDLLLPERAERAPIALCIHGGGWNAMDKESWLGVAEFMSQQGFAAFNINYRLLNQAPWPACGDDCLAAARFLVSGEHQALKQLDRSKVTIIGGSAGGHLALMTGLRLPATQVRAIVSIAGPTDLAAQFRRHDTADYSKFFPAGTEVTPQGLLAASPISYVNPHSPPLLCVHSTNDRLVLPDQSQRMLKLYQDSGLRSELFSYAGPGEQHGIWIEGSNPHRLLPELETAISGFLRGV